MAKQIINLSHRDAEMPQLPDFDVFRDDTPLMGVSSDTNSILISFEGATDVAMHPLWLRENCPCDQCRHHDVREQLVLLTDLPENPYVKSAKVAADGHLQVVWGDDDHASEYHSGWLYAHLVASEDEPAVMTWDATMADNMPLVDGSEIESEEHPAFEAWLDDIHDHGVGILTHLKPEAETLDRLVRLIGPVRASNFGAFFTVETRPHSDSLAYTSHELKPHTDLATREYQPGLQFLFCLKNDAEGGESVLVDGFRIAEVIRDRHPDAYETLTTVAIPFRNVARTSDYRWKVPVIRLNEDGSFNEIRMTYWLRAPMRGPVEEQARVYKALRLFMKLADSDEYKIVYKLKPGELMAFDNRRFLHGRKAFSLQSGARVLHGCYGEREELLSRRRIIKRRKMQREIAGPNR